MNYWLYITRPEFWEILMPPNDIWIYRKTFEQINVGDRAIILVTRKTGFTGILEITSNFRRRNGLSAFPYETKIKHIITLRAEQYIPIQEHINNLNIFKGKSEKGWGATLQKAKLTLKQSDYEYIYSLMLEQSGYK